jgi:predicted Zn-dependent protease
MFLRALVCLIVVWLVIPERPSCAQASDELGARAAEGAAAMQAGRFEQAAKIYQDLVAMRPTDAGLLMNLGMARYMAGRAEEAIAPLQEAERLEPSLAPIALFLGASLLDTGRVDDAVAPLGRAVRALPDNADAREMLARATFLQSDHARAATHYRALTGLAPRNPRAWYGLARSYQGISEEAFGALQREAPDSPLLELLVAEVAVTGDRFGSALAIYRRVLSAGPPVGGVHEMIAELYDRAGHPEWAAAELAKAGPRTASGCATRQAECLFLAGKIRDALVAAHREKGPVGLYWTIRAANRLAVESVTKLEALPASIELHLIRAEILQAQRRGPAAVAEVRAALTLAPGDPTLETALAEALVAAGNLDEALPLLEQLVRSHPRDGSVLLLYGDVLLRSQRIEAAIPVLTRAVEAAPGDLRPRASLGRAYVQTGQFEQALPHLEAAAPQDEDGEIHYQLARAYQAVRRVDDAQAAMVEYQARSRARADAEPAGGVADAALTPPD